MLRENCAGCGAGLHDMEIFLNLGKTPLANSFTTEPFDPAEVFYDLSVLVCRQCFLVQLYQVIPGDLMFNKEYTFYSGTSPEKVRYHQRYAKELIQGHVQAPRLTVEIGSNDGDLLRHFEEIGWPVLGVDPSEGPAEVAIERGVPTITEPFGYAQATAIRESHGQAGLIIANHVLAHVHDPLDFLRGIEHLLTPDGLAVIEVQYLGDLIAGNAFDHIYHEHRFYFSLYSLQQLLERANLYVRWARLTEPQGGSLQVAVVKNRQRWPGNFMIGQEKWLTDIATYHSFQGRVRHVASALKRLLTAGWTDGKLAGYGAAAKSTTLLNFCQIDDTILSYVVDTTPAKIGKFTPGTGIPIISPEQEQERGYPEAYLLLAWNYLGPLLRRSDITTEHSTRWIVPIPMPVIL